MSAPPIFQLTTPPPSDDYFSEDHHCRTTPTAPHPQRHPPPSASHCRLFSILHAPSPTSHIFRMPPTTANPRPSHRAAISTHQRHPPPSSISPRPTPSVRCHPFPMPTAISHNFFVLVTTSGIVRLQMASNPRPPPKDISSPNGSTSKNCWLHPSIALSLPLPASLILCRAGPIHALRLHGHKDHRCHWLTLVPPCATHARVLDLPGAALSRGSAPHRSLLPQSRAASSPLALLLAPPIVPPPSLSSLAMSPPPPATSHNHRPFP